MTMLVTSVPVRQAFQYDTIGLEVIVKVCF